MLVDYPSSDDDDIVQKAEGDVTTKRAAPSETELRPHAKRSKALPRLPTSFSPTPDDPSQHSGRLRSRPFADGDYYAHIYIDLANHLASIVKRMLALSPGTHAFDRLHISLSHPIPLRRHMRGSITAEVKAAIGGSGGFRVSLAPRPVVYYNSLLSGDLEGLSERGKSGKVDRGSPQPGGRAFLALVVGAGVKSIAGLLERVDDILKRHHLPVYHSNPEFHASLGWGLVGEDGEPFPPSLLDRLDAFAEDILKAQPKGGWLVDEVCIKIAKEVTRIAL